MAKFCIDNTTLYSTDYRKILATTNQLQLVTMCLTKNEEIPEEVHENSTQFIKIEDGDIVATVNGIETRIYSGESIIIPAGSVHEIRAGYNGAKLYTIYSPPVHPMYNLDCLKKK